jgi:transcriptional regulator with XRE-family HTH domain
LACRNTEKRGLRVEDLADISGISFPQIYNIESGRSQNPRDITREKLAKALGEEPPEAIIEATESAATEADVGEFVDFDPHDEADLPAEPGIYVFYDISERPIYVGQSQNIRDRILQDHCTRFWFKAPIVERAAYVRIEDENLRKRFEKVLIRFLRSDAVLNKHHVQRDG